MRLGFKMHHNIVVLQHEDCWTLSSFNKIVDTFQSLEISLEKRAFGYITHPSSDRSVYPRRDRHFGLTKG